MERTNIYMTEEQKKWLVDNSITTLAKKWGHEGKTQSEHIRDALELYIILKENKEILPEKFKNEILKFI